MLERLLVALALLALLLLALWAAHRWFARRNARIETRMRAAAGDEHDPASDGPAPRIVYFTTQSCVVCRTQQEPALDALQDRMPELTIERHDAVAQGDLARTYGVLSVPTTAVYDRAGSLVTINRGFTPAALLRAQIEGADPEFEGGSPMSSESVGSDGVA